MQSNSEHCQGGDPPDSLSNLHQHLITFTVKLFFLHLTAIFHVTTCACCFLSCHLTNLSRLESHLLYSLLLHANRQQKVLPWVTSSPGWTKSVFSTSFAPHAPAPRHFSGLWVNQHFRGTQTSGKPSTNIWGPKTGVFPMAILRHRCTPRSGGTYCLGSYSWAAVTSSVPSLLLPQWEVKPAR